MPESMWRAIISWVPFILLIVFWIYFVRKIKMSRHGELTERSFQHMDRVEALLERIADQLERAERR